MSTCDCYKNTAEIGNDVRPFYQKLPDHHVLKTLVEEHAQIKGFLDELEALVSKIQTMESLESETEFIQRVEFLSRHLLETERHHIREEIAILSRLAESHNISMTARIRKEHDTLAVKKRQFSNLILRLYTMYFDDFRTKFVELAQDVIKDMRRHIQYEDSTLYPQAFNSFNDSEWIDAQSECDRVGYCCFTPGEEHHLREIKMPGR